MDVKMTGMSRKKIARRLMWLSVKFGAERDVKDCVCEGSGWIPRDNKDGGPLRCPYHLTQEEIDERERSKEDKLDRTALNRLVDLGSSDILPVGEQQEILDGLAGSDEDFIAQYVSKQQ